MRSFHPSLLPTLFVFAALACGEDTPPSQERPDMAVDQGLADFGVDLGAPDATQDAEIDLSPDLPPDMCIPKAMCDVGACGMVEDGCGGMIDCGMCVCVDGVPQLPSCGICDLGDISCAQGDRTPICVQPAVAADVQLQCDKFVFFDPSAAQAGAGLKDAPYNDLDRAMTRAAELQGGVVLWAGDGELIKQAEVVIPQAVSVVGGFEAGTFKVAPQLKPKLIVTHQTPGQGAVLVRNTSSPAQLSNFIIELTDRETPSDSAHGLRVIASPGLVLHNMEIIAGRGGAGGAGAPGQRGADGRNGGDGASGREGTATPPFNVGVSGQGGARCIASQPMGGNDLLRGGRGGEGGIWNQTPAQRQDGRRGEVGDGNQYSPISGQGGSSVSPGGNPGRDGQALPPAAAGAPGAAVVRLDGELITPAGDGAAGGGGTYGMSGGGGGGASWCQLSLTPGQGCNTNYHGPSGGGGGGGGCGGTAGTGGEGGGSSVGLLLIDSTGIVVQATIIETRGGGAGGLGGAGGPGGSGGAGGDGTNEVYNRPANQTITLPYSSGKGGRGADGQQGGDGGGGAGGASVGIWCANTTPRIAPNTMSLPEQGGRGAVSLSADGVKAPDGESIVTRDCGLE